jgi:PilZ domain
VYSGASSQIPLGPGERRHSPRRKASSLIYVEVGSGTGGIVLDLGTNGVSCHVVQALNAEINSPLAMRLRGSGLKAEFTGELIWLSVSRKDLGLRFTNPSAEFQKEIANWIERESQPVDIQPMENHPWMRTMPAVAVTSPADSPSFSNSLSAALAMARAISPAPSSAEISGDASATPSAAVAPVEDEPAIEASEDQPDQLVSPPSIDEHKVIAATIEQRIARPLGRRTPVDAPAVELGPSMPSHEEPPQPQVSMIPQPAKIRRNNGSKLIPKSEFAPPLAKMIEAIKTGNWIPPAIQTAWKNGNRRQRLLLAGSASVCLLAVIFVFAVGIASFGHSSASPTSQAATPGAARPHRHHNSALGDFVDSLLGRQPHTGLYDDQIYIQVWASKQTGFYYCTDTPYYKDVQPGAFMPQGDALQSGYRPILGQFCE